MRLSFFIASRYLRSKKAHSAVNIISVIATCGVVLTTAALVCVLSVFNGFRGLIGDNLAKLDPPIAVTPSAGKVLNDADSVLEAIKDVRGIELALPVVSDQALAVFGDRQMPVRVKGVPADYGRLADLNSVLYYGSSTLVDASGTGCAFMGIGPAATLQVDVDGATPLMLYAPQRVGRINLANPMDAFTCDSLKIAGVFQTYENTHDGSLVLIPLGMARELFDYETEATAIEIKLRHGASEDDVMKSLTAKLGKGFSVKNRLMQQAESFRLVNIEKWVTFLLLAFIMIIATFNVVSALSLLIMEKDAGIATLRNLGATRRQIAGIFVAESWLISLVGALCGIVVGTLVSLGQQHFGWLKLNADPREVIVTAYPVAVQWTDLLAVLALSAIIGLITAAAASAIVRRKLRAS